MTPDSCLNCSYVLQPDFKFCPGCGTDLKKPGECRSCGHTNAPNAKFCAECGSQLVEAPKKTTARKKKDKAQPLEIPPPSPVGLTIEFPFSTSQTFDFAVAEAAKHPAFEQFGEGKKCIHRVTYANEDILTALELVNHLKGWRRRTVYVDGEKTTWNSVFEFGWCFRKRGESFKPELYCYGYEEDWQFNIWGCCHTELPFTDNAPWCRWGRFLDRKGKWQFDKDRIRHELQKNLHHYRFCPALDMVRVQEVFDAFPEHVNPAKDRNWKFVEEWGEDVPGLTMTTSRYGTREEITAVGVAPKGFGALKEIAKRLTFRLPALKPAR